MFSHLTNSYLEIRKRVLGKQCRPDQTPHNVASDQGLHCLLTGFSIKNRIRGKKKITISDFPADLTEMQLIQSIFRLFKNKK